MLNKRLFKKLSFGLLLCLIPVLVVGVVVLAKEESGILKITLCSEKNDDVTANKIIERLLNEEGIILFSESENIEDAYERVRNGQADAAWIFKEDLSDRIEEYNASMFGKKSLVTVVERESDISLQLSHEKLFGALFPELSFSIYKNYVLSNVVSYEQISEDILKDNYDPYAENKSLVVAEKIDGAEAEKQSDYLTLPLRGLLSVVVVLCGLAGIMYHQKDEECGVYDWLAPRKHIIPKFATCFAACFDGAVAMLIALGVSGMFVGFLKETVAVLLFVLAATAFCGLIGTFTRKSSFSGQIIPFVIFALLALSPIFFNFKSMKIFQILLPTYHYLYAIADFTYLLNLVWYSIIAILLCYVLDRIVLRD